MTKTRPAARPRAGRPPAAGRAGRDLTRLFKSLADEHRVRILFLLGTHGEMHVSALGDELGQSQPAVSHHLNQLKLAGLIECRREGKYNFYALHPDGLGGLFEVLFPAGGPAKVVVGGVEATFRRK